MPNEGARHRAERFYRTWFRYLPAIALIAGMLFVPVFLRAETTVEQVIAGAAAGGSFLMAAGAWFVRRELSGQPAEHDRLGDDREP